MSIFERVKKSVFKIGDGETIDIRSLERGLREIGYSKKQAQHFIHALKAAIRAAKEQ